MAFDDYAHKFKTIKMRREDGILELTVHTDGGSLRWGACRIRNWNRHSSTSRGIARIRS